MENSLIMSSSPHLRDSITTRRIMIDVVIALIPALLAGTVFFGARVLLVTGVTVMVCVLSEFVVRRLLKRNTTIGDFSAVVTGMLLAFNMPPGIPLWIAAVGGVVAIVVVKQLFGGLGQNFMNPALAARVILLVSWPAQMTAWKIPGAVDGVSAATPLAYLSGEAAGQAPSYMDLFVGRVGGCIGETSAAALLLGAAYLLYRRVITLEIPLTFIGTTVLLTWALGGDGLFAGDFVYHLLSGGLLLGAFFMATDYSTSPVTAKGKIIMGIGCGILTAVIRLYANYPEGVSFAIILMNILVPHIERFSIPTPFGGEKRAA